MRPATQTIFFFRKSTLSLPSLGEEKNEKPRAHETDCFLLSNRAIKKSSTELRNARSNVDMKQAFNLGLMHRGYYISCEILVV